MDGRGGAPRALALALLQSLQPTGEGISVPSDKGAAPPAVLPQKGASAPPGVPSKGAAVPPGTDAAAPVGAAQAVSGAAPQQHPLLQPPKAAKPMQTRRHERDWKKPAGDKAFKVAEIPEAPDDSRLLRFLRLPKHVEGVLRSPTGRMLRLRLGSFDPCGGPRS